MITKDGLKLIVPMKARGAKNDEELQSCLTMDWVAEDKLDGHYFTAYYYGENVRFFSRSIGTNTGIFTERTDNLSCLQLNIPYNIWQFIVCGEIVHPKGKDSVTSVIGGSQEHSELAQSKLGQPSFVIFDVLQINGFDVSSAPYSRRREQLVKLSIELGIGPLVNAWDLRHEGKWYAVLTNEAMGSSVENMYAWSISRGFEGCVYKLKTSTYKLGSDRVRTTNDWIKRKVKSQYDVVIMGFTEGKGKFTGQIGAIEFGQYIDGTLTEIGQCSGMDDATRMKISANRGFYLGIVITVEAQERSRLGRLRHPQFKGFHPEKAASDCIYSETEC